jgi:hypothetical protein
LAAAASRSAPDLLRRHRHFEMGHAALGQRVHHRKADDPRPELIFNEASDPKNGVDPKMTNHMDKLEWLQDELIKAANLTQRFDLSRVVNTEVGAEARKRAELQD